MEQEAEAASRIQIAWRRVVLVQQKRDSAAAVRNRVSSKYAAFCLETTKERLRTDGEDSGARVEVVLVGDRVLTDVLEERETATRNLRECAARFVDVARDAQKRLTTATRRLWDANTTATTKEPWDALVCAAEERLNVVVLTNAEEDLLTGVGAGRVGGAARIV